MRDNKIKDAKAACQIIWFPWINEFPGSDETVTELSSSFAKDISRHLIRGCTFSKNLRQASGTFTFFLDNSRDWKDILKPGQWCIICLDNDGELKLPDVAVDNSDSGLKSVPDADIQSPEKKQLLRKKLRGICYIERVSVNIDVMDNSSLDIVYEVSGRDFGVIYEQTEIWYNYFKFEQLQVVGLASQISFTTNNSIKELLEVTHDLFFSPGKVIKSKEKNSLELTDVGTQWVLPKTMLEILDIQLDGPPLYGNIQGLKKFDTTMCRIPIVNPLDYINGIAWSKLKQFSITELHELFPELDSTGHPRLVFRPIPWAMDSTGYPTVAGRMGSEKISSNSFPLFYLNLANSITENVNIEAEDIFSFALGNDNHNRYNHFFATIQSSLNIAESNISLLKGQRSNTNREYPNLQKGSVRRHGFRPMHVDINTFQFAADPLRKSSDKKNGAPDKKLILEYNELIFDYWNNAIFFESGNIKILGNNNIRVGKTITLGSTVPYNADKIFYVEEYVDEFLIEDNKATSWTQTLQLTRGIEKVDLAQSKSKGFAVRDTSFDEVGDFVKD